MVMTHTLHRRGSREDLKDDYVVFAIAAQGINSQGAREKFSRFLEIVQKYDPVNLGDMRTGNRFNVGAEKVASQLQDNSIVHAVFTDEAVVAKVLAELKAADLGLSIVVSGLLDGAHRCCRQAELERHTVEYSLGIWGRTESLPAEGVLRVSTMCGHGMVSFNLIKSKVDDIRAGRLTPQGAAEEMARLCHCGVFNPVRAARILAELASAR
jgi:hypothetical protein